MNIEEAQARHVDVRARLQHDAQRAPIVAWGVRATDQKAYQGYHMFVPAMSMLQTCAFSYQDYHMPRYAPIMYYPRPRCYGVYGAPAGWEDGCVHSCAVLLVITATRLSPGEARVTGPLMFG